MATLVLSTVGSIIGGPTGSAIGATIGSAIDARIFRPKGREGPRLTELKLQTSSYGQPIPRLYGTMRVAGSVIWATDLKETRSKSGGGKGQPSTTNYSYSASFAVLLSARGVQSVGRIWADGKLLRGAAGDFKSATGFRLHVGGEDQAPDPLIAAAEGGALTPAQVPAMRGQAYAVFETMQLADYGNRIPSLTFEVTADSGPVTAGTIAEDIAAASGLTAGAAGSALDGFSAYGDSVRGVLETLAEIDGAWFATDGNAVRMLSGPGAGDAAEVADSGAGAGEPSARRIRALGAGDGVPHRIAVAHYDPARDYQAGLQSARGPGDGLRAAARERRIDLPAALSADAARTLAAAALARAEAGAERRTLTMPPDAAALTVAPGERVRIAGESGLWRVARWSLEKMVVRLELARIAPGTVPVAGASGRVSGAPDRVHGATVLHAFELPTLDDDVLAAPRILVAAGGGPGWRQAALLLSLDGGASWSGAGAAMVPATLGTIAAPPVAAGSALRDLHGAIEVALGHAGLELQDADDAALDAGANLALVGDELIQFGRAERIGIGGPRWRLTRLLRGRRGTEWAAGTQAVGDRFVLIERDALVPVELPLAALGTQVRLLASGVGDLDGPAATAVALTGASLAPPAPVNLRRDASGDGGAIVRWTRRSRSGWRWSDSGDSPLVEESERYRVTIGDREVIVTEPACTATAAECAADVAVTVRQIGTLAESRPATTMLSPA